MPIPFHFQLQVWAPLPNHTSQWHPGMWHMSVCWATTTLPTAPLCPSGHPWHMHSWAPVVSQASLARAHDQVRTPPRPYPCHPGVLAGGCKWWCAPVVWSWCLACVALLGVPATCPPLPRGCGVWVVGGGRPRGCGHTGLVVHGASGGVVWPPGVTWHGLVPLVAVGAAMHLVTMSQWWAWHGQCARW